MSFFLFMALGIGSLFVLLRKRHPDHASFLITLFSLAFLARLLVGGFFYSKLSGMDQDGFFSGDEGLYFYKGLELYDLSQTTDLEALQIKLIDYDDPYKFKFTLPFNFVTLLHFFIFSCFGISVLYTKIFAMWIGSLTPILFYFFCNRLFGKKVAVLTSVLFAFWPSFFFYSLAGFKEPYLMFGVVSLLYLSARVFEIERGEIHFLRALRFRQSRQRKVFPPFYLIYFIPVLGLLALLASDYIFFLFIFFCCFVLLMRSAQKYRKVFALTAVFFLFLAPFIISQRHLSPLVHKQLNVAFIDGAGFYLYPHTFKTPAKVVSHDELLFKERRPILSSWSFIFVKGLVYSLFSPFLWSIRSFYQLAGYPQTVFILLGCFFVIRGGCLALTDHFALFFPILYTMVLFIIGHAITEGNVGAAFRHRELFLPCYLLFFSRGIRS